jgi:hypothetical protein
MGAWGEKAFENDSALDWLADLEDGGVTALRDTLSRVAGTGADDYVEVDDGSAAIAAAEIVAGAFGERDRLTEEAIAWLDANRGAVVPGDKLAAKRAVERVLAEGSELRELWDENGPDTEWHADVRALLARLG